MKVRGMLNENEVEIKDECDICGNPIDKNGKYNVCLRCGSTLCEKCDETHDCMTGCA